MPVFQSKHIVYSAIASSAAVLLVYVIQKLISSSRRNRGQQDDSGLSDARRSNGASSDTQKGVVTAEGFTTIKLSVPKDAVGAIIGKQGSNIRKIQNETKTKINFVNSSDDGPDRLLTIQGSEQGTQDAELKILHFLYSQPSKQTKIIKVPQNSIGYIIGRGGESIKRLQSDSGCQVKINSARSGVTEPPGEADVELTGTEEQIAAVTMMIREMVDKFSSSKRPFNPAGAHNSHTPTASLTTENGGPVMMYEMWPSHCDFVKCYVTATENPEHVWVQLITQQSLLLEEINSSLNTLYSNLTELNDDFPSQRPPIGTIVAAKSPLDNAWYRGKINDYNVAEDKVDVYFLDFGDSCWMDFNKLSIQLLRSQFYSLPAQAIECYTEAFLRPDCPALWPEEDCVRFETACHAGDWKVVMCSLVSWHQKTPSGGRIPVIKLFDTNTEKDIDIVAELFKNKTCS